MLIIDLFTNDASQMCWLIIDDLGTVIQQGEGISDDFKSYSENQKIIVLVPGEDVLLTSVSLPKMNRAKLRAAIPFALEEQLITDLDELHFAIGEQKENMIYPVAVVSKHKMQAWIRSLQSFGIQPDVITAVTFGLSSEPNVWHVMVKDMVLVRTEDIRGFSCDLQNLNECMQIALAHAETSPELISIHFYKKGLTHQIKTSIPIKEMHHPEENYFTDLAKHIAKKSYINLLQNEFRMVKAQLPKRKKLWQIIKYLGIALVALWMISPFISYFILKERMNHIENQIAQIYKKHFPEAKSMVAPKMRMEDQLQKLSAALGESRGLVWIGYVSKAIVSVPSIQLKRLDFQNNQLTLDVMAPSSEEIANFTDYLTQQGLTVKQQNANFIGSRMSATIVIE